jgi:hypothetical protein
MPSQLEPQLEERFGELLHQVRATRVEPSAELRERVRLLEPAPSRRPLFRRRALVLAVAGAVVVVAAVALSLAASSFFAQAPSTTQAPRMIALARTLPNWICRMSPPVSSGGRPECPRRN